MAKSATLTEWTPPEAFPKLDSCVLIDVRRNDEYTGELSHIKSAKLVTLETDLERYLKDHKEELRDKKILFICRSGMRSFRACQMALDLGYENTINLKGGMIAWNECALPVANKKESL